MNNLFEKTGATFSKSRQHRFALWRIWDEQKPLVMFIGLNPSKANETQADNTVTRCINFASDWGCGGIYMMNLFAYVSTNPQALKTAIEPVGSETDAWLKLVASKCEKIIFAWGAFKPAKDRAAIVAAMFPGALALAINKDGTPKHPLYIKGDTIPKQFTIKKQ